VVVADLDDSYCIYPGPVEATVIPCWNRVDVGLDHEPLSIREKHGQLPDAIPIKLVAFARERAHPLKILSRLKVGKPGQKLLRARRSVGALKLSLRSALFLQPSIGKRALHGADLF
jgi:hypothetical protein